MSDAVFPIGDAILVMILGIPGAFVMGLLQWAGLVGGTAVLMTWVGSGLLLLFLFTGVEG